MKRNIMPPNNTNTAGSATATAQVLVASIVPTPSPDPAPAAGLPDLIIKNITRSGNTISYVIKNKGDATASATISELIIDGVVKANDPVNPLNAGASRTESFSYSYSCSLSSGIACGVRPLKGSGLTSEPVLQREA